MSSQGVSGGGAFNPLADYTLSGDITIAGTLTQTSTAATGAGSLVTINGTQTLTAKTLTAPVVTAPVISGAATVASGATLTTPTVLFTSASVTATGATGTTAAALSAVTPALYTVTGASGAGVALPTGAAVIGAAYVLQNPSMTGAFNIYAVGGTINGTTGTTAYAVTATGNKFAVAQCSVAGAWTISGNT